MGKNANKIIKEMEAYEEGEVLPEEVKRLVRRKIRSYKMEERKIRINRNRNQKKSKARDGIKQKFLNQRNPELGKRS